MFLTCVLKNSVLKILNSNETTKIKMCFLAEDKMLKVKKNI